ncbi:unnamed protein product (macronuclear) [Paramecium tetraurelia]|uniref:DNA polymerase n=1 Tax=Paramecium tetraurelia TaxID=5888 RepID=A0BDW1_PARTE|nr:uncharacterized protein GSPATT00027758001 [Paramecium tetraurelia]CAK56728.1 unnamed protein product [Paramecium tetraurelia]|eukprot:XP_001424126.1 hypothetical protein (macronuclear) [Paramecium tetraurelia strain d4-2]
MFPLSTVNLTNNRIKTLRNLIERNGGTIELNSRTIMIVGSDATSESCQKQLEKMHLNFEQYRQQFINADWISQSLQAKNLLDFKKYQLFSEIEQKQKRVSPQSTDTKFVYIESLAKTVPLKEDAEDSLDMESGEYTIIKPEMREKYEKKKQEFKRQMIKENRFLLDYEYDKDLDNYHHQVDDGYEFLLDNFQILKKEEFDAPQQNKFYGDEDCQITEIRKPSIDIFQGLDMGKALVNVDQPLVNAQIKETKQFQPGSKQQIQYWENKREFFICDAGSAQKCYNNQIIEELEKLLKIYTNEKDKGRCIAYRKAIGYIKSLTFPIRSSEDLKEMPTIGEKIKNKIIEIIQTGQLVKVQKLQGQEKNVAITQLSRVWGIGPTTAATFYFKGIKTLDDLRKNQHLLNRNQQVCLQLVEELEQRIPRDEATIIYDIVKREIDDLSGVPGLYKATACGSYRREKETCGDMDILITRCDGKNTDGFLLNLIQRLEGKLLTHHLTIPRRGEHDTESYMGIGRISNNAIHRRIDLKFYPKEQYGCAVLYFTGSDQYNRSMRLWAQKIGYSLSDHGLYPTQRGSQNKELWKGEVIACEEEIDVYRILGLQYKPPKERSV